MKRIISVLLLILVITASCASLLSCGNAPYSEGEGELKIVATCFPAFDFAREIAGEKATIQLLQHNGEDMHDFFPTTSTLSALKDADIFICVGGSSDNAWLSDALDSCNNPDLTVIKLMDYVTSATPAINGHNKSEYCTKNHTSGSLSYVDGTLQGGALNGDKNYAEEAGKNSDAENDYKYNTETGDVKYGYIDENGNFVELKPGENANGGNFSAIIDGSADGSVKYEGSVSNNDNYFVIVGGNNDGDFKYEYNTEAGIVNGIFSGISAVAKNPDEHVWLSPKAVIKMVDAITDACIACDGANEKHYTVNASSFKNALAQLDSEITEAVEASAHKTLIFADRFPFVYLTQDYGICYYSAYAGCDANVNASFETQANLTEIYKSNSLPGVIVLENADLSLAENVISGTSGKIFQINSLQKVTSELIEGGMTYIDVMKDNLNVLKEALK